MKTFIVGACLLAVGIPLGWSLGGFRGASPDAAVPEEYVARSPSRIEDGSGTAASHKPKPWKCSSVELSELEGLQRVGHSPAPRMFRWISDTSKAEQGPEFRSLCDWLKFPGNRGGRLASLLADAAQRQLDWERRNLPVEMTGDASCRIPWRPAGEVTRWLQDRLVEEFGETLAKSIWLKGDLENFARPREVLDEDHGTVLISVGSGPPGRLIISAKGEESGRQVSATTALPFTGLVPDGEDPQPAHRFFHLVPLQAAERAPAPAAPDPREIPIAEADAEEGYVTSPYNGLRIDVRGIPAGTLVQDPGADPAEKRYFRIPGDPEQ